MSEPISSLDRVNRRENHSPARTQSHPTQQGAANARLGGASANHRPGAAAPGGDHVNVSGPNHQGLFVRPENRPQVGGNSPKPTGTQKPGIVQKFRPDKPPQEKANEKGPRPEGDPKGKEHSLEKHSEKGKEHSLEKTSDRKPETAGNEKGHIEHYGVGAGAPQPSERFF